MKRVFLIITIICMAGAASATGERQRSENHSQEQGQHQGQSMSFNQRSAASSSADLFVTQCTNGVSGQGFGGGGAVAITDKMCKIMMARSFAQNSCYQRPTVPITGGKCEPEVDECGTEPNPDCARVERYGNIIDDMVDAEIGWFGWKIEMQNLPAVVSWLF